MFDSELGGQISWLLPLAVVGLVGGLWLTRRRHRNDHRRAGFVLWGATLLMYLAVYDYAQGIFHPYYTVVMAPAVAALAGAGAVALWRLGQRSIRWAWVLPATIVGTVVWADALLARTSGYDSWLGPTVVVTGVVSALVLFLCMTRAAGTRWLGLAAGTVAAASVLAGPAAYSLTTVGTTTTAIATAGPTTGNGGRGGGAGPGAGAGAARVTGGGGGAGGSSVNQALVRYLEEHQGSATYLVAVSGSQAAAPFILQSGKAVIAMGGFGGTDPAPTLSEFEHLVATGKVHYVYISGGTGGSGSTGGSGATRGTGIRTTGTGSFAGRPAGGGGPPRASGSFGGAAPGGTSRASGQTSSTASTVDSWVEAHGTVVSSSANGGSSAAGPSTTSAARR